MGNHFSPLRGGGPLHICCYACINASTFSVALLKNAFHAKDAEDAD